MMGWFQQSISSDFMPHGFCYLWNPRMVWLHVISDALIALSYYCIPVILVYFVLKHRHPLSNRVFLLLFGVFILACGTTHLLEIWNVWHGNYLLAGIVKAITAGVSVITAAMLIPLVPKVISLPGRMQLEEFNRKLDRELAERRRVEAELQSEIVQRSVAQQALRESLAASEGALQELAEQKFALDQHAIVAITDVEGTITYVNDKFCAISQYSREELIGQNHRITKSGHHPKEFFRQMYQTIAAGQVWHGEIKNRAKDGSTYWLTATIVPFAAPDGKPRQYVAIRTDITERKQAEQALRFLSDCNAVLARTRDEASLVKQICELLVRHGGYRMAWVEYAEADEKKTIGVAGQSGVETGYLEGAQITWAEEDRGRSPAGTAIRSGHPALCRDVNSDPLFAPWRELAAKSGYRSCLSLPLKNGEEVLGALSIYSQETDAFEIAEQQFLGELAANLSFGIVALRALVEQKRTEEARERLASVVESSDDAIISKGLDGTITSWNSAAEKLFGYSSTEALGESVRMLFPPERVEEESGILARIGRGESVQHFETVRVCKDGRKINVSETISPIKVRGVIVGASKIARDITKRKETEEQLATQAEELARSREALEAQTLMLQSVLDSISEGLVVADEHENFIIWNPAAKKIIGLGAAELAGGDWSAHYGLFLPDTVTPFPTDRNPLIRAVRGEECTEEIFVRNAENPAGVWIEASAGPLKDTGGVGRGGVCAFRDITQSKAVERQIRQLNDELEIRVLERTAQLEAANHELEAFSYSVSHDLRAPLRHISGFSQLLLEEFGTTLVPEARSYAERIQSGAHKMGLLVDELLNLARVGRHALNLRVTNLNDLVAEVVAMLQPEKKDREVEWAIGELPLMECDAVLVKQILQNLLANALKFTRSRARALIEVASATDKESGQPVLMVRDNGTGFDMKYVNKLFGVFQRLHREEEFEGTGIGLATVQRIVKKHGGRVWAEAAPDQGAAFYFTLTAEKPMGMKHNEVAAGGKS